MNLLILFGTAMLGFGCFMVAKPRQFSKGIVQFSEKPWFHIFEIVSRGTFGVFFLLVAGSSAYPTLIAILGGVLCFVSLFLIIIGPARHKRFALLTSSIGKNFRALGFIALACGAGLIYLGLAQGG